MTNDDRRLRSDEGASKRMSEQMTREQAAALAAETREDVDYLFYRRETHGRLDPKQLVLAMQKQQRLIEYLLERDTQRTGDGK